MSLEPTARTRALSTHTQATAGFVVTRTQKKGREATHASRVEELEEELERRRETEKAMAKVSGD